MRRKMCLRANYGLLWARRLCHSGQAEHYGQQCVMKVTPTVMVHAQKFEPQWATQFVPKLRSDYRTQKITRNRGYLSPRVRSIDWTRRSYNQNRISWGHDIDEQEWNSIAFMMKMNQMEATTLVRNTVQQYVVSGQEQN